MLNCHQATRLISQAQDMKIAFSDRFQLTLHLQMCSGCRHFRQQLAQLRNITQTFARGENER